MNVLRKLLGTTVGKCVALALVSAGAYQANEWVHSHPTPSIPIFSSESHAAAPKGNTTVEFVVASAYMTERGKLLLNDREDYQEEGAKCVVVPVSLVKSKKLDAESIVGKTIKVAGRKSSYKGCPQIVASSIEVH